jgi:hypothetical protein
MTLLGSKVHQISEDTISARGGQIFPKRTFSDSDTSQAGVLCGARACRDQSHTINSEISELADFVWRSPPAISAEQELVGQGA